MKRRNFIAFVVALLVVIAGFGIWPKFADPQADLKTTIHEFVRLLRAGDMIGFLQINTMPGRVELPVIQKMRDAQAKGELQNPDLEKATKDMAQTFANIENQTPTYNAAGDEASYTIEVPADPANGVVARTDKATFMKINGRWYLKPLKPADKISN